MVEPASGALYEKFVLLVCILGIEKQIFWPSSIYPFFHKYFIILCKFERSLFQLDLGKGIADTKYS
jgi:hypothetical protein